MSEAFTPARLRQLRDTAWTAAGYLYWQRGDPDERKQAVWREHKRTGLHETLRELVEMVGPPWAIAIREHE